ncbi:MAG: hypothetical protein E3J54_03775 [Actinobacteria bacterium]|nr:MAG: hypothetical protein E3J54_03775 [Actinomycetota bacterium]
MESALTFIPALGAIICFAFAFMLFRQYLDRKAPHQIAWGFAMVLFGVGFVGEVLGFIWGWNQFSAKVYYLFGGVLAVGYLSLGTIYLLKPNTAKWISSASVLTILVLWIPIFGLKLFNSGIETAIVIIFLYLATIAGVMFISTSRSILAALITVTVLATIGLAQHNIDIDILTKTQSWRDVMTIPLRSGAFALSAAGTLIVVIGAAYSVITGWRDEKRRPYAYTTLIIAIGVLIAAFGGTLHGIFDIGKQLGLSITTTIGIGVMFAGFLQATKK